jgi:glycosyltransferase involved in cell wall biosynthesis
LIARTAKEFAAQVVSLLTDPERCNSLAERARERVECAHDWDKIGDQYASLLAVLGDMTG